MNQMKFLRKICCKIFWIMAYCQSGPLFWPGWTPWLDQYCTENNSALYLFIISTALIKKIALYMNYIAKIHSGPPFRPLYCPPLWWYAALCSYTISRMHISPKLMDVSRNYLCNQLLKVGKLKKGENSDQKVIGPLSQGHVRFKLSVQIVKGDVFEGHPGPKKCEMTKMGLKNRFTWKIAS